MANASNNITIGDIYSLLKEVKGDLTEKIEIVDREIKSISSVLNYEITDAKRKIKKLEEENLYLRNSLETLERKNKNNNLVFYGVQNKNEETDTDLIDSIVDLIEHHLHVKLDTSDINNIFRLGKHKEHTRPILVSFISYLKKKEILKNCKLLKGTKIYICEDLLQTELEERKILLQFRKEASKQNHEVKLRGNKLIISGREYTASDLQKRQLEEEGGYFSPPPERNINSAPPTPTPNNPTNIGQVTDEVFIPNLESTVKAKNYKLNEENTSSKKNLPNKSVKTCIRSTTEDTPKASSTVTRSLARRVK